MSIINKWCLNSHTKVLGVFQTGQIPLHNLSVYILVIWQAKQRLSIYNCVINVNKLPEKGSSGASSPLISLERQLVWTVSTPWRQWKDDTGSGKHRTEIRLQAYGSISHLSDMCGVIALIRVILVDYFYYFIWADELTARLVLSSNIKSKSQLIMMNIKKIRS